MSSARAAAALRADPLRTPSSPLVLLSPSSRTPRQPLFTLYLHIGTVFTHQQAVGNGDQTFKWLARVACDAFARECNQPADQFIPVNICDTDGRSLLPFDQIRNFCRSGDHVYVHLLPPNSSAPFDPSLLIPSRAIRPRPVLDFIPAAPSATAAIHSGPTSPILGSNNKSAQPLSPLGSPVNASLGSPVNTQLKSVLKPSAPTTLPPLDLSPLSMTLETSKMPVALPMSDAFVADSMVDSNTGSNSSCAHLLPPQAHRQKSLWELFAYTPTEQYRRVVVSIHTNTTNIVVDEDPWVAAAAESSAFDHACMTPAPTALTAGNQQRAIANLDYTYMQSSSTGTTSLQLTSPRTGSVVVSSTHALSPRAFTYETSATKPPTEPIGSTDPFAVLLPKTAVPHITGNFLSWGPPIPMVPAVRTQHTLLSSHAGAARASSPSSPSATDSEGVETDAPTAHASSPVNMSNSAGLVPNTPRPQLLRGLDNTVPEDAVLTAADRRQTIERGAYSFELFVPPGAELLFSIYIDRQCVLSSDHDIAVFPAALAGGRRQVNHVHVPSSVAHDFAGNSNPVPTNQNQPDVSVQFEDFRNAKAVIFQSAKQVLHEQQLFQAAAGKSKTNILFQAVPLVQGETRTACIEKDWADVNLADVCRQSPESLDRIHALFADEYEYIVDTYRNYACMSTKELCHVTRRDFLAMCSHLKLIDLKMNSNAVDTIFDRVCSSLNQLGDGEVGGIVHSVPGGPPVPPADPQDAVCKRGHFFEMLMRVVLQRCPQVAQSNTPEDAVDILIQHYLIPNLPPPSELLLRSTLLTPACQTVLQTHLPTLTAAFRKLCMPPVQPVETVTPSAPQFLTRANRGATKVQNSVAAPVATKKSITPAQFAQLMTDIGVTSIPRRRIYHLFIYSQTIASELPSSSIGPRPRAELLFCEFVEAVARVADAMYDHNGRLCDRLVTFFKQTNWSAYSS